MRFPGDFLTLRISKTATFTDHFLLTYMASLWNIWITVSTVVKLELDQCVVLCHLKARCYSLVGNLMEFKIRVYYFRHQGSKLARWLKIKKKCVEIGISTNFSLCHLNLYFYYCSKYTASRVLCLDFPWPLILIYFSIFLYLSHPAYFSAYKMWKKKKRNGCCLVIITSDSRDWILCLLPT